MRALAYFCVRLLGHKSGVSTISSVFLVVAAGNFSSGQSKRQKKIIYNISSSFFIPPFFSCLQAVKQCTVALNTVREEKAFDF
jgi:hypothetical protein